MKKIISLLLACLMIISIVPVVSAETVGSNDLEKYYNLYWNKENIYRDEIYPIDNFKKVGDWYYVKTENYTTGQDRYAICGYDGTETEITLPTELEGNSITRLFFFAMLSDTVITLNIPKEISSIQYKKADETVASPAFSRVSKNLEAINVSSGNWSLSSRNGVLLDDFQEVVYLYPPNKKDEKFYTTFYVRTIADHAFKDAKYLKILLINRKVKEIGIDALPESDPNVPDSGLSELRFKNCILTTEDFKTLSGEADLPKVQYGTVSCVEDSPLYHLYNNLDNKSDYYTELATLPKIADRISTTNGYEHFLYENDMRSYKTGFVKYNNKWFYLVDGKWNKIDGLLKYNGQWFYLKNGKWAVSYTGLIKYKGQWFYITNGKWRKNANTLVKKNGKWLAIKNSKWYKGKAIISYGGKRFYVNNGFARIGYYGYWGNVKIDGKTYKIINGKVA